jgi:hypothetical protein
VRRGQRGARTVMWIWAAVEIFNATVHCIWAVTARGYVPGLVSGLGFVPVTAYLIYLLRRSRLRTPASDGVHPASRHELTHAA